MAWGEAVQLYCERGADASMLAEPLNALTNLAFLAAAFGAWRRLVAVPAGHGGGRGMACALIVLVAAIGIGSGLFHTFATRWAQLADVVPIGLFMFAYLAFALRSLLGAGWTATLLGILAFGMALGGARVLPCPASLMLGMSEGAGRTCLNGSLGYVPAVAALLLIGGALIGRGRHEGRRLLGAGAILGVSLGMRTLDPIACPWVSIGSYPTGLHFLWHLLNAWALCILLKVAVDRAGEGHPRSPGLRSPAVP